ncbi:acetyl-CoA C-acyltransferase family protein [Denitratisoma oestradiolicum]|uniref:Acetyl-CoA acetyltransferase n=1 Tax=Denitratisoma oestradiolicum TaxID=311182 RepID=A0A6S6Y5Q5_9PROT|nr:acetyl-CoA C-acyltransferase family protein [Denitratisoma oestradiolicum]TWO81191.1 acetyl-CoA acetyltransferase [Denitratisoma oestradiolicum]CAB1367888.1 acetyl-CoA acetyltransferase [Denitratisoma oestradiolicum]
MSQKREVVVVGGARTAIGSFGGGLKDIAPCELGAHVVKEAIARAQVDPARIGHLVMGNVVQGERRDMYVSRVAALNAGLVPESCALTLNRLCGSGFQAIVSAAQSILLGDTDVAVGAGVESMSRGGYLMPGARWGARMGDAQLVDMMVGALTDPFSPNHMGITAENLATKWNISRAEQDQFALESQQKAVAAIAAGHFKSQIVPVEIKTRKGMVQFDTDEYPKADASLEGMAKLKPAFKKDGSVTAGNASGINDGAAAVVLMEAQAAAAAGLKPLARMVSYGIAGVDPNYMGEGPIPAVKLALQRAGLGVNDIDVIESNEAFAVQSLCVSKALGFDPAKVNPNGGAVALGHPIGATGVILTIKCIYELQRTGKRYGLVTMCIGGGQGIAGVFERL